MQEQFTKDNRYRFRLDIADGTTIEGGAESRQLCLDHVQHCLLDKNVKTGWYLGRNAKNETPQEVRRGLGASL